MITCVTPSDFKGIINSFTKEEIKEKYGRLVIKSEEEYKKMSKQRK